MPVGIIHLKSKSSLSGLSDNDLKDKLYNEEVADASNDIIELWQDRINKLLKVNE